MPCNRCSICGVSWPTRYEECPMCGRETDYFSNVTPDEDHEDVLAASREKETEKPDSQAIKIAHYKRERYTATGLDLDRAMLLAGDHDADLPMFEALVKKGCSLDTAYDIVRSR